MLRVLAKVTLPDRLVSRVRISHTTRNTAVRPPTDYTCESQELKFFIRILLVHVHGSFGRLQSCQIAD